MKLQMLMTALAMALLPGVVVAAGAQDGAKTPAPAGHAMVKASSLQWGPAPPSLPSGAQAAVLAGDPGKPGMFTLRLKMPAGYRIGRHWHPTDEAVTVLEGEVDLSMGKADGAYRQTFGAGDFVNLPAHMQHEAISKGGAVVQVQGTGPFEIHYVDAKDDPRAGAAQARPAATAHP